MGNRQIFTVMVLATLFLIAGCSTEGDGQQDSFSIGDSFRGGDKGLSFSFAEQAPPDSVRDQALQPFSVRLLVKNEGEYDIPENSAYVTLTGFNPSDLGIENRTSRTLPALRGFKKQGDNTIPGAQQQVVFDSLRYENSVVSGSIPLTIYANVCYPYETESFALLCINGNTVPAVDESTQICELDGNKQFANSGGPVKIENVKQYPYGENSIQFQFDIVHTPTSDQANLYAPGSINNQCQINGSSPSSSDALFQRDKVRYEVESGIEGLSCEGSGSSSNTVTLTNDRYTVTCVQDTQGQSEYQKPVTVNLAYDYLDRKSTTVQIEHIER